MTTEQMLYFYNAAYAVDASMIDAISLGVARVMTDSKGSKSIERELMKMRDTLVNSLSRKNDG